MLHHAKPGKVLSAAQKRICREKPRHILNNACCTQLNHAHHDVSLLSATSSIWCLPAESHATNSCKPTPRETQAHSVLIQIALLPKTPKITHSFHEEDRRTKDDGRISHKGGSSNRRIHEFWKGSMMGCRYARIAYEKQNTMLNTRRRRNVNLVFAGMSYTEVARSVGVSKRTGKV